MACDVAAVNALAEQIARASTDRVTVAAAGWTALCEGDAVLDGQMGQITAAGTARWWLVELQVGMVDARRWVDACPSGGTQALSMATKLDPAQRRPHLWGKCDLVRFGVFTEAEWAHAPGLLLLPVLAAYTLESGGIDAAHARPVVRALAGL